MSAGALPLARQGQDIGEGKVELTADGQAQLQPGRLLRFRSDLGESARVRLELHEKTAQGKLQYLGAVRLGRIDGRVNFTAASSGAEELCGIRGAVEVELVAFVTNGTPTVSITPMTRRFGGSTDGADDVMRTALAPTAMEAKALAVDFAGPAYDSVRVSQSGLAGAETASITATVIDDAARYLSGEGQLPLPDMAGTLVVSAIGIQGSETVKVYTR